MHNYMFKSRMGALVFAALVIIGAVSLVGGEESPGTIVEASDDIAREKAKLDADMEREERKLRDVTQPEEEAAAEAQEDIWSEDDDEMWLDDEELIDDAVGFDPAPMIDSSVPDIAQDDEEAILLSDG